MLQELRVENLLLLDRAELHLAPGLNVLTGETGAGKTLLAHALDLLLGGRARSGIVRKGAGEAYVEGVFSLPGAWLGEAARASAERLIPAGADELFLARRVWPDGRTRAYVCGRSATVADLRELGGELLAFYGQHEHRKLMLSAAQLEILDSHCGATALELRAQLTAAYDQVRRLQRSADELCERAGARERELDLVGFELDEIESVAPSGEEEFELEAERQRLRHQETLRTAAAAAVESISADEGGGMADLLGVAARQLDSAAAIDPQLGALNERLQGLLYEAQDLAVELRSYLMGIEAAPGRLEEIEERLEQFARLRRKHGGTIADVLCHAAECRRRREELQDADQALERVGVELAEAQDRLEALASDLRRRREHAAPKLARAVRARLGELSMPEAKFEIELQPRTDGCGPRGADTVELLIAPNAGAPAGPLREIASGGELSRVMLALLSVTHGVGQADGDRGGALLVFDEIDAGIGGHTARAVGRHLRELAGGRQVLCITHLPQVAALAERHFTIVKDPAARPARTTVAELSGEAVVGELVRMLGAGADDRAASQHARQLLEAA